MGDCLILPRRCKHRAISLHVPAIKEAKPMDPLPTSRHRGPIIQGRHYLEFLDQLHKLLRPRTYLEIGTASGESLALAQCPSIAIDPHFAVDRNVVQQKPMCLLFQMTSDSFFSRFRIQELLGSCIDFAFLDGMHLFEFLVRDFANTEQSCETNSVIAIHDCLPEDEYVAARRDDPAWRRDNGSNFHAWTGDVWKLLMILKQYRPELSVHIVDAAPTGLVLITHLDPTSKLLREKYFDIVRTWTDKDFRQYGIDKFYGQIAIESTDSYLTLEGIASKFWLPV